MKTRIQYRYDIAVWTNDDEFKGDYRTTNHNDPALYATLDDFNYYICKRLDEADTIRAEFLYWS